MNTSKPVTFIMGLFLIFSGAAALLLNSGFALLGLQVHTWRFWPLFILGIGLVMALAPLLRRGRRGMGGLFIPAMPIITTGVLLGLGSLFNLWHLWASLWPLELLSLALGFILFAAYAGNIWLLIPALFIGATGAVLQFCALSGWWSSWAVLWTVEPLCVGLMLLLVAWKKQSWVVMTVGWVIDRRGAQRHYRRHSSPG